MFLLLILQQINKSINMKKDFILSSLLTLVTVLSSCTKHPEFKNSGEALQGCREQLEIIKTKKDVDIKTLTELTRNWLEVQDSAYNTFNRDTSMSFRNPVALAYFMVSDSIKNNITRLALSQQRTLADVMYLKVTAIRDREKIHNSETYANTVKFYKTLDENKAYVDVEKALPIYIKVLSLAKRIKTEGQLLAFIKEEDKCYRTIMQNLSRVTTEKLQQLTTATSDVMEDLYIKVGNGQRPINDRTMLYLTMRFNRRIVQNAEACVRDIKEGRKLSKDQKANYRWMLIQPYIAIDDYSTSVLTEEQKETLIEISKELPDLMIKLETEKEIKTSQNKLTDVLATFFMKSFITTTL